MNSSKSTNTVLKTNDINRTSDKTRTWVSVLYVLLTVVVFFLLIKLALWQNSRGEQKQQLEQKLLLAAEQEPAYLKTAVLEDFFNGELSTGVKVSGTFVSTRFPLLYLDNQTMDGKVGYLVYQIMRVEGFAGYALIELGFVPYAGDRNALPDTGFQLTSTELSGRVYSKGKNPLSSDLHAESDLPIIEPPANLKPSVGATNGKALRVQNLNWDQLEKVVGIDFAPLAIQPLEADWPLAQPWQPLPLSSAKHFGYSFQWAGLAIAWLVLNAIVVRKWILKLSRGG